MEKTFIEAIAKAEKSVVAIARAREDTGASKLTDPNFIPNEFGTGVVVDRQGLILTNLHVLGDPKRNEYAVWLSRRPYRATVKATDPWSDLAVLSIEADKLTPIEFGDADDLRKGQIVITLGNPYAIARDGEVSAGWGMISNLSRKAPPLPDSTRPSGKKETMHHYGTLIQTDARLHLGTSGGALLNLKGQMIGLTTSLAARAGYEKSVGYAIPVDSTFKRAIETLKQGREVEYGLLGVVPGTGSSDISYHDRRLGRHGVRVTDVFNGTPAKRAGVEREDIITHVDGRPVFDSDSLILEVGRLPVMKNVRLTIRRGSERSVRVMQPVVELSKKAPVAERPAVVTNGIRTWRGMRVDYATAMPGFQRRSYVGEIDPAGCVAVVAVEPDSPAFQAGCCRGVFVSHVAGRRVSNPDEFHAAVSKKTDPVSLRVSTQTGSYVTQTVKP